MLKFIDVKEVFAEIPDEITLAISISGCPIHCKGCHSKYLWEDKGEYLTTLKLKELIKAHTGITCVCFMGGDQDVSEIEMLSYVAKHNFPKLKIGWYSGKDNPEINTVYIDYLKLGPYIEEKGPLTSKTTNQKFLAKGYILGKVSSHANEFYDITNVFQNESKD